jgi:hypothetical protein
MKELTLVHLFGLNDFQLAFYEVKFAILYHFVRIALSIFYFEKYSYEVELVSIKQVQCSYFHLPHCTLLLTTYLIGAANNNGLYESLAAYHML